jgi:hypothetical protein
VGVLERLGGDGVVALLEGRRGMGDTVSTAALGQLVMAPP